MRQTFWLFVCHTEGKVPTNGSLKCDMKNGCIRAAELCGGQT